MSADREWPDPDLPQDPGIPGEKTPEELPPQDEPEVARVAGLGAARRRRRGRDGAEPARRQRLSADEMRM